MTEALAFDDRQPRPAGPWQELGPAPGHRPWSGLGTPFVSSIYWSAATGAHVVTAEIREAWLASGGPAGPLGYPITDEAPDAGGRRFVQFQHGRISWSVGAGATIEAR